MKKIFYILTAALLLTGALLTTGCTNDDTANDNNTAKTVTFTATLAPKGGGEATRAITVNNQNTINETLTTAWKVGEKIAICYQKTNGDYDKATATVGTPNADGSAPITATLTDAKGGEAQFIYPATLKPDKVGSVEEQLLSQHGNLMARTTPNASIDDISTNFDYVMGRGTLSVNAETAAVSSNVTMENEVCICKFHFALDEGTGMGIGGGEHTFRTVTIDDGDGHIYTITSDRPDDQIGGATRGFKSTDDIYVAMLPIENKTVTFSYTETQSSGKVTYRSFKSNVTLEKGKFYRNLGTITMVKSNPVTLTSSTGEMTLHNGDILTGTGGTSTHVTIDDGATIMLLNATIPGRAVDNASDTWWAGITCTGDANIILAGGSANSVRGYHCDFPGIIVPSGKTLTILGNGSLTATSGTNTAQGYGAGIGGKANETCGNIKIEGGTIIATGGNQGGAGIGGCYHGSCGNITISGGTVTATGGLWAAGIGSGSFGRFASISIGSGITSVTATRSNNYWNVPIGKGNDDHGSGAVTFDGVTMHDGREDYMDPSDWTHWPETGGPFDGIQVSASDYGNNGRTWTLTPAP